MELRLRRVMGMLKLGKAAEAAEAAAEASQEAGQPPLAAVSVAARVAAAGAKSLCDGEVAEEAVDELTALKVLRCRSPFRCCYLFPSHCTHGEFVRCVFSVSSMKRGSVYGSLVVEPEILKPR